MSDLRGGASADTADRFYFRQLLAGGEFAQHDPIARQMQNFVYLIGDRLTGECVVVDPAWDVQGILDVAAADDMNVTGVLLTHYHPDHCGGSMMGIDIEGVAELLGKVSVPVHVQADEADLVSKVTELRAADMVTHTAGDTVMVGQIPITLLHTPGHTPGSQCFYVNDSLVAGDTLFLEGCGRTDLPGGDPEALYYSLTQTLAQVPDEAILYPGHFYSAEPAAPMGHTRQTNFVFRPRSAEQWLSMFG